MKAEVLSYFPVDPRAIWALLAAEFESQTVSGDHVGIITTHVEDLAAVVTRYLRAALPGKETEGLDQ